MLRPDTSSTSSVAGPAMPSGARPARCWKRTSAFRVVGPNRPSTAPRCAPARSRRNWSTDTSHPTAPCRRIRLPSSGVPSGPSAVRVLIPAMPSTCSEARIWNARIAAAVAGPAMPSIGPAYRPCERSATWRPATCGFVAAPASGAERRTARAETTTMSRLGDMRTVPVRDRRRRSFPAQVFVYSGPEPPSGGVRRPPLAVIAPHWTQLDALTCTVTVPCPSDSPSS